MGWGYNKYHSKRVQYDNHNFSSKLEAAVYQLLKQDPNIEILQCQARVKLTKAEIIYIPDFKCLDKSTNKIFFCEAKGVETSDWQIKLKLWRFYGPAKLHIYKGSHIKPYLKEIVIPEGYNIDDATKEPHNRKHTY